MKLRILIADDHEVVRRGLSSLLQAQEGWEVVAEASDGREAVEKAKELNPDFIILDIGMPNLNGLAATRQLVQHDPNCKVIVLTITDSDHVIREALDAGARGATTTFVQRGIGDALIAWESEALVALKESGQSEFELVTPSLSILAEPPVTWVDKVVNRHGTKAVARAYLEYLYSPEGQEIAARHYYRPRLESVAEKYAGTFPKVNLFTIDEVLGGWQKAQKTHFNDGGVFDQIQTANR